MIAVRAEQTAKAFGVSYGMPQTMSMVPRFA